MKLYWSYTQFPELAAYSNRQKKIIWLNLGQWSKDADQKSWAARFFPALFLATFISGIAVGAFCDSNPQRGGLVGGLGVIVGLAPIVILVGINTRRRLLKHYLESEEFSLLPVNREVRILLDPFRPHDDT